MNSTSGVIILEEIEMKRKGVKDCSFSRDKIMDFGFA